MTKPATEDVTVSNAAAAELTQLLVVARDDVRFCMRIRDVSEVGRIVHLTCMEGPDRAFLGSMVLHGWSVPVIDVAMAIGAVPETVDQPRMFVALQTQPTVCIAVDELLDMRERSEGGACEGPHELIRALVTMDGRSLPVIDVLAVSGLADGAVTPAVAERDSDRIRMT